MDIIVGGNILQNKESYKMTRDINHLLKIAEKFDNAGLFSSSEEIDGVIKHIAKKLSKDEYRTFTKKIRNKFASESYDSTYYKYAFNIEKLDADLSRYIDLGRNDRKIDPRLEKYMNDHRRKASDLPQPISVLSRQMNFYAEWISYIERTFGTATWEREFYKRAKENFQDLVRIGDNKGIENKESKHNMAHKLLAIAAQFDAEGNFEESDKIAKTVEAMLKKKGEKSPEIKKLLDGFTGDAFGRTRSDSLSDGTCVSCGEEIDLDDLSEIDRKEFGIYAMCPKCTDFSDIDEDWDEEDEDEEEQYNMEGWHQRQEDIYGSRECPCGSGISPEECCG